MIQMHVRNQDGKRYRLYFPITFPPNRNNYVVVYVFKEKKFDYLFDS